MNDKANFWERKILEWESSKYVKSFPLLDPNNSVKYRRQMALDILMAQVKGKKVLELGCGSGFLAPHLMAAGATSYDGIDFAPAAINNAKKMFGSRTSIFTCGDVLAMDLPEHDICFSLGLLDWLSLQDISQLKTKTSSSFLHSFSEERDHWHISLHKAYVYLKYGRKGPSYVPQYYTAPVIQNIFNQSPLTIIRHKKLSFGCFIHNFKPSDPYEK